MNTCWRTLCVSLDFFLAQHPLQNGQPQGNGKEHHGQRTRIAGLEELKRLQSPYLNWAGKATPMFYRMMRVVLTKKGDDYVFLPDIPKKIVAKRK